MPSARQRVQAPSASQYLDRGQVMRLLGIQDRAALADLVRMGAVPRPIPPYNSRWLAADIEHCVAQLPAAIDPADPEQ